MTDMVIPPEAVEAGADAIEGYQIGSGFYALSVGAHDATKMATAALEAALPHLRPMLELAGNLGRELGRREAAEEAAKLADDLAAGVENPEKPYNEAFVHACGVVARHIREIATKEPVYKPEASRTRCSHCGFYRPSLLNHHPDCPHASSKP